MSQTKRELQHALPFAMEPVVYDFAINERGTWAELLRGDDALLPRGYYALHVPRWLRADPQALTPPQRAELDKFSAACRTRPEFSGMMQILVRPSAAPAQIRKRPPAKPGRIARTKRLRPRAA